jgi:hypothetical protein
MVARLATSSTATDGAVEGSVDHLENVVFVIRGLLISVTCGEGKDAVRLRHRLQAQILGVSLAVDNRAKARRCMAYMQLSRELAERR